MYNAKKTKTNIKVIQTETPESCANEAAIKVAFNNGGTVKVKQIEGTSTWCLTDWDHKIIAFFADKSSISNIASEQIKVLSSPQPELATMDTGTVIAFNAGRTTHVEKFGDSNIWSVTDWDHKVIALFVHEDDICQLVA